MPFDLLKAAEALLAADSVSARGNTEAVAVLRPLYEQAGLEVMVQELALGGARQLNLLGRARGEDHGALMLLTHLDTVDPGPAELWTETGGNPFRAQVKGDRIYGLGAADVKLDALCKVAAFARLGGRKLRRPLVLAGTFGEEIGCLGTKSLVSWELVRPAYVMCGEPSELRIVDSHKGYVVLDVNLSSSTPRRVRAAYANRTFEGKSAHSSTPQLGANAVEAALAAVSGRPVARVDGGTVANKVPDRCQMIAAFGGDEGEQREEIDCSDLLSAMWKMKVAWEEIARSLTPKANKRFEPRGTVTNLGRLRAEEGAATFLLDMRLLPGHRPEQVIAAAGQHFSAIAQEQGLSVSVRVDRANPAMQARRSSTLLKAAQRVAENLGLNPVPLAKAGNTEAGVFAAAGAQALVFGPGPSVGNAHCPNEHNRLPEVEKAIDFYQALITEVCL